MKEKIDWYILQDQYNLREDLEKKVNKNGELRLGK